MRQISLCLLFALLLGSSCQGKASARIHDSIPLLVSEEYTLVFAGDIMAHGPQLRAALRNDGTYDFTASFDSLKPLISRADLAIGNLETTFAGSPYSGYPLFSTPDAMAYALRDVGFDILTTSNNHTADRHARGIVRTLDLLDSLGIAHTGAYRNAIERAASAPLIYPLGRLRLAIMAYTYGTNGMPIPQPTCIDTIDRQQIARDLAHADSLGADYKIVQIHWGNEYERTPSASQRELAQWLHQRGADAIIGSHPHVVQHSAFITDSICQHTSFVIYSLGNFISNQRTPVATRGGMLLTLRLRRESPSARITTTPSYQWVFVNKQTASGRGIYRLLPVDLSSDSIPHLLPRHEATEYRAFRDYYRRIALATTTQP